MSAAFSNPIDELIAKISEPLKEIISSTIKNNSELYRQDGFKQVAGWIQESNVSAAAASSSSSVAVLSGIPQNETPIPQDTDVNNMDSVFSGLAEKIIENLMQHVPNYFGQMLIDGIKIKTQGKEKSASFDLSYTMDPIKPYVEFVKKANGVDTLKIKTKFQIDSDIKMSDLGFLSDDDQKIFHLGNLVAHLKVTLLGFGLQRVAILNDPKILREQEFEKDLTEIKLSV